MTAALITLSVGVLIVLLTIAANGYFVAQEFAYMSVDRNRLRTAAATGDKAAARALEVTDRTSFMLSGAQLGITVTGLIVGYVAEPLVGQSLGVLLGGVGVPPAVSISVGTVLALTVATVIQMIFAELFPKNYALANSLPLSRWLAASTLVYLKVFGWIIRFFDISAVALLKLLRIEPVHDVDSSADSTDLEHIVDSSHRTGAISRHVYLVVGRVLDFPDHTVEHAMIPRGRSGTVEPETPVNEIRALMAREHTRYPVLGAQDEPLGTVHLADVLRARDDDAATAESLMRPPLTIPTAMTLPEALDEMEETGSRMACVIDEYGGLAGVMTLEDLAEEIFGEITDEHDPAPQPGMTQESQSVWTVDAGLPLDEIERSVGHRLPSGDFETLAGLILAHTRRLPILGEEMQIPMVTGAELPDDEPSTVKPHVAVTVLSLSRRIPHSVRLDFGAADLRASA